MRAREADARDAGKSSELAEKDGVIHWTRVCYYYTRFAFGP